MNDSSLPVPATVYRTTDRGTYRNPVLWADYSDPDAVRVGDRWYLTASSFSNLPGLPVLVSDNLVEWTLAGMALPSLDPADHFATPRRGGGVWAPALRYENGVFSLYYPDPDFGIFRIDAADPAGPWSEPFLVDPSVGAIDPCPFTDDDGSRWLIKGWAKSRAGINNRLTLNRLGPDGRVADQGITVVDGFALGKAETSLGALPWITIEGPKLLKVDGWYYILAPAGGVKVGWQAAFRSRSLPGPWEARNVMDQGSTAVNGPHQGALVDGPDGRWWFLHFQDQDSWGRVVHLQPVTWTDGWPVVGTPCGTRGEPVTEAPLPYPARTKTRGGPAVQTSDAQLSSSDGAPGPLWQWQANPRSGWVLGAPAGGLKLACMPQSANPWENPAVLTRKLEGPACGWSAQVTLSARHEGEEAGLAVVALESATLALRKTSAGTRLVLRRWDQSAGPEVLADQEASPTLWLKLTFEPRTVPAAAPPESPWPSMKLDRLAEAQAWWSTDGSLWTAFGAPFLVPPGKWVGAQTGFYALAASGTPAFAATSNGWAEFSGGAWTVSSTPS